MQSLILPWTCLRSETHWCLHTHAYLRVATMFEHAGLQDMTAGLQDMIPGSTSEAAPGAWVELADVFVGR